MWFTFSQKIWFNWNIKFRKKTFHDLLATTAWWKIGLSDIKIFNSENCILFSSVSCLKLNLHHFIVWFLSNLWFNVSLIHGSTVTPTVVKVLHHLIVIATLWTQIVPTIFKMFHCVNRISLICVNFTSKYAYTLW